VLGASIGPMIMGRLSDNYAHEAMVAAGATEMAMPFLASGLHKAMYVMPLLVLLCAAALFGAATTVAKDMRRREGITEVALKPDLQKT
jgi:predicted MFS family arabinose efflux permease